MLTPARRGKIPLWVKVSYTLFVLVLVPIYWREYPPDNFLWFSHLALLITVPALWLESSLLASMMAVGVFLPEVAWTIDFLARLIAGVDLIGLTRYMLEPDRSLLIRGLALFHVALPFILLWMVSRLGYDPRAWLAQTLFGWTILIVTYLFTDPDRRINWVFGPGGEIQTWMPPRLYLFLLMIFFLLFIYWPTHSVLNRLFGESARGKRETDRERPS